MTFEPTHSIGDTPVVRSSDGVGWQDGSGASVRPTTASPAKPMKKGAAKVGVTLAEIRVLAEAAAGSPNGQDIRNGIYSSRVGDTYILSVRQDDGSYKRRRVVMPDMFYLDSAPEAQE